MKEIIIKITKEEAECLEDLLLLCHDSGTEDYPYDSDDFRKLKIKIRNQISKNIMKTDTPKTDEISRLDITPASFSRELERENIRLCNLLKRADDALHGYGLDRFSSLLRSEIGDMLHGRLSNERDKQ